MAATETPLIAKSATTGMEVAMPVRRAKRQPDVAAKPSHKAGTKADRRRARGAKMPEGYAPVARVQEAHSPTVEHMVAAGVRVDPATGQSKRTEVAQARRRAVDAEFAIDLTPEDAEAMEGIRRGWQAVVGAVAIRGASYGERIGGTYRGGDGGPDTDITTHYRAWAKSLAADVFKVTIAVVCEGYTLRAAAGMFRNARRDHHWAKRRLGTGLRAWGVSAPRRKRRERPEVDWDEFFTATSG